MEEKFNFKLLTVKELVAMTSLSKSWIYQKVAEGFFPQPIRIGRNTRWKSSDIQNWINSQS